MITIWLWLLVACIIDNVTWVWGNDDAFAAVPTFSLDIDLNDLEGKRRAASLAMRIGDDLRRVHREFCEANKVFKAEDQISLFLSALNMIRSKTDIPQGLTISSRLELPSGEMTETFTLPLTNDNALDVHLHDLCSDTFKHHISTLQDCHSMQMSVLHNIWDVVGNLLVLDERHRTHFIANAKKLIDDESVTFLVELPMGIPTGLGNVLRGLVTSLSVHENTKLRNRPEYVLGDYESILNRKHMFISARGLVNMTKTGEEEAVEKEEMEKIVKVERDDMGYRHGESRESCVCSSQSQPMNASHNQNSDSKVINFVAWRFLVLKEEEEEEEEEGRNDSEKEKEKEEYKEIRGTSSSPNNGNGERSRRTANVPLLSPELAPFFSSSSSIDGTYSRSLIPSPVVKRIMRGIRRLHFKDAIYEAADRIADTLLHPSLGEQDILILPYMHTHHAHTRHAHIVLTH